MPCQVLAGIAVAEDSLWNLVRTVRYAEQEHFGGYLRDCFGEETKAKKLLKRARFKRASRN